MAAIVFATGEHMTIAAVIAGGEMIMTCWVFLPACSMACQMTSRIWDEGSSANKTISVSGGAVWKNRSVILDSSANCDSTFIDLAPNVSKLGESRFYEFFAGRAFANFICTRECSPKSSLLSVTCGSISLNGDGTLASHMNFVIECKYVDGGSCSQPHNWQHVEDAFFAHCTKFDTTTVGKISDTKNNSGVTAPDNTRTTAQLPAIFTYGIPQQGYPSLPDDW
uniref:Uncharacterized protein n=1 Tax=Romanomermis culicivorax TaxID=13658 RepID=A0A915IC82_ROMCU